MTGTVWETPGSLRLKARPGRAVDVEGACVVADRGFCHDRAASGVCMSMSVCCWQWRVLRPAFDCVLDRACGLLNVDKPGQPRTETNWGSNFFSACGALRGSENPFARGALRGEKEYPPAARVGGQGSNTPIEDAARRRRTKIPIKRTRLPTMTDPLLSDLHQMVFQSMGIGSLMKTTNW